MSNPRQTTAEAFPGMNAEQRAQAEAWLAKQQVPTDLAAVEARTEARMLAEHNLALGVWGIPKGAQGTFSRRAFYGEALRLGVITTEEHEALRRRFGAIFDSDLSD